MRSSRSNLFTNFNSTWGTEIGKGGPLLAAKISPGGEILEGDQNFRYSTTHIHISTNMHTDTHTSSSIKSSGFLLLELAFSPRDETNCEGAHPGKCNNHYK